MQKCVSLGRALGYVGPEEFITVVAAEVQAPNVRAGFAPTNAFQAAGTPIRSHPSRFATLRTNS